MPMKGTAAAILLNFLVLWVSIPPLMAQTSGNEQQQPEFIKQGQQLLHAGKLDEALALYRQTLQLSPDSFPANIAAGTVLDLMGNSEEARESLAKAIQVAGHAGAKGDGAKGDGDVVCLRWKLQEDRTVRTAGLQLLRQREQILSSRVRLPMRQLAFALTQAISTTAYDWYQLGHDTGLKEPNITSARRDLWEFRWEHAQARIAARRGNQAEAQKHVVAAKNILAKGTNPEQAQFLPYLQGYVAFYAGEYKAALQELLKANQNDPFIACMIGQTYEKLGDDGKALEYYHKASTAVAHNPAAAYAVPLAKKKLVSLAS